MALAGGEEEGEYDEEGEGGYMSDDSVDPDDMTYEVRPRHHVPSALKSTSSSLCKGYVGRCVMARS